MKREMKKKVIFLVVFASILFCSMIVADTAISEVEAASKRYTKMYSLKRNFYKSVKLKSTIRSVQSSNKKIATVTKSGKKFTIIPKKKGTVIITVRCKNKKRYSYVVKVSKKKHKHKWQTITAVQTIHHPAEYTTEEHVVASDGHDFGEVGAVDMEYVDSYCKTHGCSYTTTTVEVLVKKAWNETITKKATLCKRCSAAKK